MINKYSIFIISAAMLLASCGSGSSNDQTSGNTSITPQEAATALENQINNIGELAEKVNLPSQPTKSEAQSTVTGVDSNNNGTRDELEHIAYQGLNTLESIDERTYNKIKNIMNMLQPQNPPVANSINEHDIYCSYQSLTSEIKKELPLSFLYSIVLDTQERRNAFNASLEGSIGSLGEESCE